MRIAISRRKSLSILAAILFLSSVSLNSAAAQDAPPTVSSWKHEAWVDLQYHDRQSRNGIDDQYSKQGFFRYTLRTGYMVENAVELTPYFSLNGVNSWTDSFACINNIEPSIGVWMRPLRPVFNEKSSSAAADMLRNFRILADYSPDSIYLDDDAGSYDQDGSILRFAVDWYGEHKLGEQSPLTGYVDVFSQYRLAEEGPDKILQWYSRIGIATDYNMMRLRFYGRWNGAYGFDAREPWSNNNELGGGIVFQPFFGLCKDEKGKIKKDCSITNKLLSDVRLYGEYLSISYMDRNNRLYLDSQPDSYVRFGIEFWFGRD